MSNGISTLVFVIILGFLGYYFWVAMTPFYFHDTAPNVPMQTVIGGRAWYFPMGYIEPHYPQADGTEGGYVRGGETEVWLSLESGQFKIIPQDVSTKTLQIGPVIDVILSSDLNPKTKKAMQEFQELKNQTGFENAAYGLKMKEIGNETEYLSTDTRISCGPENCTLFTTRIPDVRTAMIFNRKMLPTWNGMVDTLAIDLQPFRQRPDIGTILKDFIADHPTGIDKPATTKNGVLLPPGSDIPEATLPTLNTK